MLCSTERSASNHPHRITASDDRSLFRLLLAGRRRRKIIATNSARMIQSKVSYPSTTHPTSDQQPADQQSTGIDCDRDKQ